MSNRIKLLIPSLLAIMPTFVMAAALDTIQTSATTLSTLITGTLPRLFFGLAVVYFFYGLGQYALGIGDDKKKQEAKTTMIYGVIVIFVMASIWGIVVALQTATGTTGGTITVPTI